MLPPRYLVDGARVQVQQDAGDRGRNPAVQKQGEKSTKVHSIEGVRGVEEANIHFDERRVK